MPSMVRQHLHVKSWQPAVLTPKRPTPHKHVRIQSCRFASDDTSKPARRNRWLRVTAITAVAVGIGAYVHSRYGPSDGTLNPVSFTKYELASRTPVSSTSCIFTLRPLKEGSNWEVYQDAWQKGIWSVQFKQPQLQIGRNYTPLPPLSSNSIHDHAWDEVDEVDGTLKFLIRRDPYGEVSGYLHDLQPGSTVEVRGPQMEYEIPSNVQEVLFIAGGTGIAPAIQAAHTMFRNRDARVRMHVLWANRQREDCAGGHNDLSRPSSRSWWSWFRASVTGAGPQDRKEAGSKSITVAQLEDLKTQYPGLFTVDYFVDEESTLIGKDSVLKFTGPGTRTSFPGRPGKKKLILISGPDGFISYLAGPKIWKGGVEAQGPLQGLLRQLDLRDWAVWKL